MIHFKSQRGGTTCANSLKLEMNKFKAFVVKKKQRESTQPLIENNNDIQDGKTLFGSSSDLLLYVDYK